MNSAMRWSWVSRFMRGVCHENRPCASASPEDRAVAPPSRLLESLAPGRVPGEPAPVSDAISRRVPHVVTRADLAWALTPTYSAALGVDEDEAHDRLERALQGTRLLQEIHAAVADALSARKGPRTTDDAAVDKLSAGVQARRSRVKAAPEDPAISAVLVRINLEIGLAPESMRQALAGDRGKAMLDAGMRKLADHLVKELLK
jgi:hypothetical protein